MWLRKRDLEKQHLLPNVDENQLTNWLPWKQSAIWTTQSEFVEFTDKS